LPAEFDVIEKVIDALERATGMSSIVLYLAADLDGSNTEAI